MEISSRVTYRCISRSIIAKFRIYRTLCFLAETLHTAAPGLECTVSNTSLISPTCAGRSLQTSQRQRYVLECMRTLHICISPNSTCVVRVARVVTSVLRLFQHGGRGRSSSARVYKFSFLCSGFASISGTTSGKVRWSCPPQSTLWRRP